MRLSKSFVFKQLAVIAGLVGAGTLLSLPALAATGSHSEGITIAQSNGGTTDSGESGVSPANPDATGGEAFEQAPGQPLPDANQQDGTTTNEGSGSGAGGVQDSQINPANPDAEGGEAFEREPTGAPLPSETEGMDDSTSPSGTTTDEGSGSGQGGYSSPVNPANPDAEGGDAFERAPGTQPIPDANEQSGGASGTYNQTGQTGTTTNDATGGGAGGGTGSTADESVRALW